MVESTETVLIDLNRRDKIMNNNDIIDIKKAKQSITDKRGFDVIKQLFFVEEIIVCYDEKYKLEQRRKIRKYFTEFSDYYRHLDGDIYTKACYYQMDTSKIPNYYDVDYEKLYMKNSFTDNNISDDVKNDIPCEIDKKYIDGKFQIIIRWYENNNITNRKIRKFDYFFDFVDYLEGDLSGADLILCDGLVYLNNTENINFSNAKITSWVCEKLGIDYKKDYDCIKNEIFNYTLEFEKNTLCYLEKTRNIKELGMQSDDYECIFYLSDIHLIQKIEHYKSKSKLDVLYVIKRIVKNIVHEVGNILLIGGDTVSDFKLFEAFISILKKELDRNKKNTKVFFVLGNHELWDFSYLSFEGTVKKYEETLNKYGFQLIQNNIAYCDVDNRWKKISESEITEFSSDELREILKEANFIIFGGIAFSGMNKTFNAKSGLYKNKINRKMEIEQSVKFNCLYKKIKYSIPNKKVVVLTHTPLECWSDDKEYHNGYVYVSGHTHKNFFYDDGEKRIYADNQIGYYNNTVHLKCFELDNTYDYFIDYDDGIYEISVSEYLKFYRGRNIVATFNHNVDCIYMLKKDGYYCFLLKSADGKCMILNGGGRKKLLYDDIHYYYNNMDKQIAVINPPFTKYTNIQRKISDEIKRIGGIGTIHGCIVDIDCYNHIYINPIDMKITGYWAENIINKRVYVSIITLLKTECPMIYSNYLKCLKDGFEYLIQNNVNDEENIIEKSFIYFDTDIYKTSKELKKMQRLRKNILTVWYENNNNIGIETI